jgi:hypothetical protein
MKPLATALCFAFLLGCSKTPPGQQSVEADTPINFAMWRSKNSDVLTPKEWTLFGLALEEFKLRIMMDGQASGGEAVDLALRNKIDGMKLGEVMQSGLKLRLARLSADQSVLEESLLINSRLKLKPGDDEKAQMLAEKLQEQSDRLAKMKETVAAAETDLQQIEMKFR